MSRLARTIAALVLLGVGLTATPAAAQVFLASEPYPRFGVGPLFIVVNVKPDLATTVNVSFSLTFPPNVTPGSSPQDLYLLWPAEIVSATAPGDADPAMARDLAGRGFTVLSSGRLGMTSRDRLVVGTGAAGTPIGIVSYVTFTRPTRSGVQLTGATWVKIPWTPKLVDPLHVVTIPMPVRGLVTPKPATWVEETFWGKRWILTTGFGDLGAPSQALYPLYFEHRDRAILLAREFSQVLVIFEDVEHLRIDEIAPAAATRRPTRARAGGEVVTLVLNTAEATTPQTAKVQFHYFQGRIAWRPIVVSLVLLLASNVAGAIMFGREIFSTMLARRRARLRSLKRRPPIAPGVLAGLTVGLGYDEVVRRLGDPDEDRQEILPNGHRALVYRAELPAEVQEVEIALSDGALSRVERRVRRVTAL
jgi:hypothetical protein